LFRRFELVLGFLIATAFWVAVAVIYPKYYGAEYQATKETLHIATEAETNERIANYNEALAWLTALLVAANLLLWWTTWRSSARQTRDMKASIKVAERSATAAQVAARAAQHSAEVAERAFEQTYAPYVDVAVKTAAIIHRLIGGNIVLDFMSSQKFAEYIIHNYGSSPAIVLEIYPGCVISSTMPDQIQFPPPQTNLRQIIVVGGMKESEPQTVGYPMGWSSDANNIWIMLQIRYRDVFRDQYVSNFCFFFNKSRATFDAVGGQKYNNRRKLTEEELKIAVERDE
jgi:hypothetical protein